MKTFQDIIDANGGPLGLHKITGINRASIHSWYNRNSIPAKYWLKMIEHPDVTCPDAHQMAVIADSDD